MKKEIWKDVVGYEELYQVSTLGNIRGLNRIVERSRNGDTRVSGVVLKQQRKETGYLSVRLSKGNVVRKKYVHRVVAEAFIERPAGHNEVNHIDENKENNTADNLEWCTREYNVNYGDRNRKAAEKNRKRVIQIGKDNKVMAIHESVAEAAKAVGSKHYNCITACLTGRRATHRGFRWEYA